MFFRCQACGAHNRVGNGGSGEPICGRCKRPLDVSGAPQEIDGQGLERAVRASPIPVLVDYWASWCGPCKVVAPILDGFARAKRGELLVLKLDTEQHAAAASQKGIRGIPTFILFSGGRELERRSGALPAAEFHRWLEPHLSASAAAAL